VDAKRPDGTREQPFKSGEGMLIISASGHFSIQLCKQGRPKYASNNRVKGTPEEYKIIAEGCNTYWGRYVVREPEQELAISIEHAMFPNLEGVQQRLFMSVNGDELSFSSPGAAGGTADLVWVRTR
jgi:hypothetical protein